MAQAVTNRVRLGIVREVTPGTTPASPTFRAFRFNSSTLAGKPITKASAEILSDRQVPDLILVGQDTTGVVSYELSAFQGGYGATDLVFEGAFASAWVKTPECDNTLVAGACSTIAAATDYPVTTAQAWKVGMLVRATGFTTAANNKNFAALAGTTNATIKTAGLTLEAAPATARLKCIGFQGVAGDVTAVTAGGNALVTTTLDFTTLGLVVGQWISLGTTVGGDVFSFVGTAANNGWCRISLIAASRLSFDVVPTGWAADAAAGKTIRGFFGDYLRNGTTVQSHTLEQSYVDITQYQYFRGGVVGQMSVQCSPQAILTGSATFDGMSTTITGSQVGGAVNQAAPTFNVLNSSSNIGELLENGVSVGTPNYLMDLAININNNDRKLAAVANIGWVAINQGQCVVTGTAKFYFGDTTILAKAIGNTQTALSVAAADASGNTIHFDLPKVKLSSADAPAPGVNQDIMVNCAYQALKHATLAYTIQCSRLEIEGTNV